MARRWRMYTFGYSPSTYTRTGLKTLTDAELRSEYAHARREIKERLRSFARSKNVELRESLIYLENKDKYKTLKDISGDRGLMEDLLLDAYRLIINPRSTVSGYKSLNIKISKGLQAAGYDIDVTNLDSFGKFMDFARARKDSMTYGSGTRVAAFEIARKQGISRTELQKHYSYYMQQVMDGKEVFERWQKKKKKKNNLV